MTDSLISDAYGRAAAPAASTPAPAPATAPAPTPLAPAAITPAPAAPSSPPVARTLLDVFAATVARCPNRTAIDAPDRSLTYAELQDTAVALAQRLAERGIGPGDKVGVQVPSGTADLYVAILGVLHSGAAYVPVDADDTPARAQLVWDGAEVCAVIEAGLRIGPRAPAEGAGRSLTVDDDAWVIFTSGSTGKPKGVAVSHQAAAAFVDAEAALFAVEPADRVLAGLSVGFDASCEEMWLAWRHGAALVPAPRELVRAGAELGPWVAERGVTVISTVPTLAAMWDPRDIADVRLLIVGGEACPEGLVTRLAGPGRRVWNTYGPTEATVVSTATQLEPGQPVTIGWPLRGWEVAIIDPDGNPVQLGEPGELVVGGVGLGRYLDPELDATRYAPLPALGWERAYRTGDVVRETAHGLAFIGRQDDQVKIGGRRLELGEVEAHLSAAPGVRSAAAAVQCTEAGNPVLVDYVVGSVDASAVRAALAERLPTGISPVIVELEALPVGGAGKVDRKALPWPPPAAPSHQLTGTVAWLAERWAEQLGPLPVSAASDFFELGGSSLAAAKLVSVLRQRFPAVAVADVYQYRQLGQLAERLDSLATTRQHHDSLPDGGRRRFAAAQLVSLVMLFAFSAPQWLIGILAIDRIEGGVLGPQIGWGWLLGGWLLFGNVPGRALIVVATRRLLLPRGLRPGRYPRRSWLTVRLWFLERLAEVFRNERLAGTPFAARWARLSGQDVGSGARLGTLPPVTSLVSVGPNATIEGDVDMQGWHLEGSELVVGQVTVGAGARVGTRSMLLPGAEVGAGAEIEPGSVVSGAVPAGERWGGLPAAKLGSAGCTWPKHAAPKAAHPRFWKYMFLLGVVVQALLPLLASLPVLGLLELLGMRMTDDSVATHLLVSAPLIAAGFLASYALLVAGLVRLVGWGVRPGFHPDQGPVGFALWWGELLLANARGVLFSLYSSIYTRHWLRLAGIQVGKRAEISTAVGLNRLTRFAPRSFATDDVVLAGARARQGWLHVAPIEVGRDSFLGNGAIVPPDAEVGDGCLVGVQTTAPRLVPDGTSWFGVPALELPRTPDRADAARTVDPPARLIVARGTMDLIRILLPATLSVSLGAGVLWATETLGQRAGLGAMALATPFLLLAAGLLAGAATVGGKWLIMGRYRPGNHPLWSFFVWRDEILNSLQDQLAGHWLLGAALGTPLMSLYLRAMGAKVGRDVWCETLTITEFDCVELGDGCAINRSACVETHLFHDRLMRIGPTKIGAGASLAPHSAVLPDTVLGEAVRVGSRSVVMRGEELPAHTSWLGAPVVSV